MELKELAFKLWKLDETRRDEFESFWEDIAWEIEGELPHSLNTDLDDNEINAVKAVKSPAVDGYSEGEVSKTGIFQIIETGEFYSYTTYSNSWDEGSASEVTLREVVPVEKTITVYEAKK